MSSNLIEQLTINFYEWEQRGRGWLIWDAPVELEPPFEPFYYREKYLTSHAIDDGKRPTILSSIVDGIKDIFREPSKPEITETEEYNIAPAVLTDTSILYEISLVALNDARFIIDQISQVLLLLSSTRFPLSFEIIGLEDSIFAQIVCREDDLAYVRQILKSHLPDVISEEKPSSLFKIASRYENYFYSVVDFGLSEEFMRPLKSFKKYEPDPLTGVIGVLENLQKDEAGILQILFKGSHYPWAKSIINSVTDCKGDSFFMDAPEMVDLAYEKIQSPLFAVSIKALTLSSSASRTWDIMKDIYSALNVTSNYQNNELIPLSNEFYPDEVHLSDFLLRQTRRSGMLLNSEELMTLVHIPSPSINSFKLKRIIKKSKAVPAIGIGHRFILGENTHNGKTVQISLSSEQRLKHIHIIGATGSGKSTLLLNMILQDLEQNNGIAVLDPHGDLIEEILSRIPEKRSEDVILFDPSDTEFPVGFNILNAHSEVEKNILESDLVATFKRYSTTWGDQMTSVLGNAIHAFLESSKGGTLLELRRFLLEEDFRNEYLKSVNNSDLIYYWQKQFPLLKGNSLGSILVRLDSFLRSKIIKNIVAQKNGLSFENIMNEQKIFLVKLSQGLIGEENAGLLGTLLISKFHQTAMARQAIQAQERKDFHLYIDEFQQFVTPSMTAILSGARKYKLSLTLSHQEMRQLYSQNQELVHSLISNAGTRICFRLGDFDAEKLKDGFSYFTREDLQNLAVGEAICKIEKAENDFNLKSFPVLEIKTEIAEKTKNAIRAISYYKHSKKEAEKINKVVIPSQVINKEVIITSSTIPHKEGPHIDTVRKTKAKTIQQEEENLSQHRYLQNLIKKIAEDRGYKAVIEAPTIDKQGRVDISLEKNDEKIAIEIAITTSEEHEYQNVKKCISSGYKKIIVCTIQEKRLEKLKYYIKKKLPGGNIQFLLPDDLIKYLTMQSIKEIKQEQLVKGYRVKVQYNVPNDQDNNKRETISRVLVSLKKERENKASRFQS
jgi:hypothetical protein